MAHENTATASIQQLEDQLNSFDTTQRTNALNELAGRVQSGSITLPREKREVNLHFHTFFSYNANGWSPSRVAWEARKYGLAAAGIVDFDVLDGMEEFLSAGEVIGLRSTAALETRVFIEEMSAYEMSSPNEPGIAYFMAGGCFQMPEAGSKSARIFQTMREMARRRNVQVMELVNDHLDDVRLDYDADVLPLTPSGNATERHMLAAYDAKSRQVFSDASELASFWSRALAISTDEATSLLADEPKFHDKIRAKLMKFGGVGYVPPNSDTFPSIETVTDMILGMEALPMIAWLDGTTSGEADMPAFLGLLASKGVVAMNIIPDRNWNIKNPEEKKIKVENLAKAVKAAREIDFPLCVGTEMNKAGLPFVDDFNAPELAPYIDDFIEGADMLWGHTFLARNFGIGYASKWAESRFGDSRRKRNEFYARAGRAACPITPANNLAGKNLAEASPEEVIRLLGEQ